MNGFTCSQTVRSRYQVIACHFAALAVICLLATVATAQETSRFDLGTGFTVLAHGQVPNRAANFGPSFTGVYNITHFLSLEGTFNWFPTEAGFTFSGFPGPGIFDTSAVQALFGVKAGYRARRFGVFAKVRPGLISAAKTERSITLIENPIGFGTGRGQTVGRLTEKVLDVGGVFECYLTKRWALRVDAGDTLIFNDGVADILIDNTVSPPTTTTAIFNNGTSNHFQLAVGAQFRF